MVKNIDISIIIAVKNEEHQLPKLLTSLKNQDFQNTEIIVVDNHSTDDTLKIANSFGARVFVHGHERSEQRNFGTQNSHGKYLLFLDADMKLPHTILSEIIDAFTNKKVVALIIPETVPGKSFFAKVKRLEKKLYENEPTIEAPRAFIKRGFLKIGGYAQDLIAGEDWDIGQRILTEGKVGRISSRLFHCETSFFREINHKLYYAKHISRYQQKHPRSFEKQSEINRIHIFWKKRQLLFASPVTGISLMALKSLEFILYIFSKVL